MSTEDDRDALERELIDSESKRELLSIQTDGYVLALALLVRMSPWAVSVNRECRIVQMVTPKGVVSWPIHNGHMHLFENLPASVDLTVDSQKIMNQRLEDVIQTMDRLSRQLHSTR